MGNLESGKVENQKTITKTYTAESGDKNVEEKVVNKDTGEVTKHTIDGQPVTLAKEVADNYVTVSEGNTGSLTVKILAQINSKLDLNNKLLTEQAYYLSQIQKENLTFEEILKKRAGKN